MDQIIYIIHLNIMYTTHWSRRHTYIQEDIQRRQWIHEISKLLSRDTKFYKNIYKNT